MLFSAGEHLSKPVAMSGMSWAIIDRITTLTLSFMAIDVVTGGGREVRVPDSSRNCSGVRSIYGGRFMIYLPNSSTSMQMCACVVRNDSKAVPRYSCA